MAAGRAPPHLMLQSGTPLRFSATVGCNTFAGGIEVEGERLRFGQAAATLMACPEPLDAHERALGALLDATVAWRISGDRLELLDAQGMAIAELAAVERE